jgi:hypothetical protein
MTIGGSLRAALALRLARGVGYNLRPALKGRLPIL